MARVEQAVNPADVIAAFQTRTDRELPYLRDRLRSSRRVLDIGCGPACTTTLLARELHWEMLYLMDANLGEKQHQYHRRAPAPWQDMAVTAAIAVERGIAFTILAPNPKLRGLTIDTIVSLLSWGHHYPVEEYLDLAKRSLGPGGRLILDLRRGRGGQGTLEKNGFIPVRVLDETPRCERWEFLRI